MRGFAFLSAIALSCTLSASLRYRRRKRARVLTPADGKAYVSALSSTNRFCPVRCASKIVEPSSTSELAEWIRANHGTPFTVKGGGHSYGCQSVPTDGGVLINTVRLNHSEVFKRQDGTAFLRAGPGLTFDEVIPRLDKMGYSMPHGECMTVGLGGWTVNVGHHPELRNFENAWGYDGKAYLTKATFVDYDGTIFTVDKEGLHLVELGETSWLSWHSKALKTKALAKILWVGSVVTKQFNILAVSNVMRVFKAFGASLAIATEFEIELLPKPEPGFFKVGYGMNDLLDEAGGKGKQLMQDLVDVVVNAGTDPDIECGIFYGSESFPGTKESIVGLKCVDWASPTGATVKRVAPPGYRYLKPKKSGFMFWTKDSFGKGWVPLFHAERVDGFLRAGGAEKYRDYLRALESSNNPCDACSSELMFMLKPLTKPHVMFDNLCSGTSSNQDACSEFVLGIKDKFLGNRSKVYKQNLPSCAASKKWKSEVAEYSNGAYTIGTNLKNDWDRNGVVDFWLGLGHKNNGGNAAACEATRTQRVGATCQQHGITADDLVEAELANIKRKCPIWDRYTDWESQDSECAKYVYNHSTPLPLTVMADV